MVQDHIPARTQAYTREHTPEHTRKNLNYMDLESTWVDKVVHHLTLVTAESLRTGAHTSLSRSEFCTQ
jgi:hypothetical protein